MTPGDERRFSIVAPTADAEDGPGLNLESWPDGPPTVLTALGVRPPSPVFRPLKVYLAL